MDPPPLLTLNSNPLLKVKSFFKFFSDPNPLAAPPHDPSFLTPDLETTVDCKYYDDDSLSLNFSNSNKIIIASLNIQSLNSKFENLKNLLPTLPPTVQILALQETWKIPYL